MKVEFNDKLFVNTYDLENEERQYEQLNKERQYEQLNKERQYEQLNKTKFDIRYRQLCFHAIDCRVVDINQAGRLTKQQAKRLPFFTELEYPLLWSLKAACAYYSESRCPVPPILLY